MIALPPLDGAVHETVAEALPAVAATPVGAPGAVVVAGLTVSANFCDAVVPTPLLALNTSAYVPGAVVDATVSVGLVNVTPAGKVPDSVNVDAGKPLAVTVKLPATPEATV